MRNSLRVIVLTMVPSDDSAPLTTVGAQPAEPVLGGFIGDTLDYAQGHDPLNPKYKPQFRVTYRGELKVGETVAKVTRAGDSAPA